MAAAVALAGCGGGAEAEEKPSASGTSARATTTESNSERTDLLTRMGGDPNKSGVASLPTELQPGIRQVAGNIRRLIIATDGVAPGGSEDDVSCATWLGASDDLILPTMRGLSAGIRDMAPGATPRRLYTKVSEACALDRRGSAMDLVADTVIDELASGR